MSIGNFPTDISSYVFNFLSKDDSLKFRLNKNMKTIINESLFFNKETNTIYNIVFKIIKILTDAYELLNVTGKSYCPYEIKKGFLPHGYNIERGVIINSSSSILIDNIITPFGMINIGDNESLLDGKYNGFEDYIKSRIQMIQIAPHSEDSMFNCGPYYIVTHIDGELIDHPNIKKYVTIKQMYDEKLFLRSIKTKFIDNQFNKQIEHLMKTGKIADKYGIISRLMFYNSSDKFYDDAFNIIQQIFKNDIYTVCSNIKESFNQILYDEELFIHYIDSTHPKLKFTGELIYSRPHYDAVYEAFKKSNLVDGINILNNEIYYLINSKFANTSVGISKFLTSEYFNDWVDFTLIHFCDQRIKHIFNNFVINKYRYRYNFHQQKYLIIFDLVLTCRKHKFNF
jgi:hypothetical protein